MTVLDAFTRLVVTWLHEEDTSTSPHYLDEILARTSTTRQRPAWLSPGRWLPMATTLNRRAITVPPVVRWVVIAGLLLLIAVAAVTILAGSRQHRVPPPLGPAANGSIYFDVDGTIVTANPDGSGRRTIDVGKTAASAPYVSPDGTKFSFVTEDPSTVAGDSVWTADADGSNVRRISGNFQLDIDPAFNPTWSPDSTRLAFGAYHEGDNSLFVANADGSGVRQLGVLPLGAQGFHLWTNPEWSLSGDWIAFADEDPGVEIGLAVIHPDGTGYHRLPAGKDAGQGFRGFQLWAPDGTNRLLYAMGATPDYNGDAIAVMDVDTGVETVLSDEPGVEEHRAAWSPDAKRVAFHLGSTIAVVNADGSGRVVLRDALGPGALGWSPDGKRVFGQSDDGTRLVAIDVNGQAPPVVVPLDGTEAGVFSWQRLAP